MNSALRRIEHEVDVCVVGGGMAGLVAAVAAARRGARTILIHDRPVLGGNASSEVRMWICGAHGPGRKETGILEEIQLANLRINPSGSYSVWDSVLWGPAFFTPGLTTLLNTTVNDAQLEGGRLASVDAWQLTTQTWHRVSARFFIDASGDSILAPLSGAEVRQGRESREEFGESIAPPRADLKTMGNTLLLQLEETPVEQPFEPPVWADRFDDSTNLPSRVGSGLGHNFWWLELGGLKNTIDDAETIANDLLKAAWGVWDYMKNRGPQADKLRCWRLRWLGALPGKRENRRYVGDHLLTQHDVEAGGPFEDVVAYGGWSMDDHHPGGLYYPGAATIFHPAPSPYGIPFRSLYSRNVPNLFCAGRNISATHCALSSTRVMGTCAVIGQAVGTAAALCVREGCGPRDLASGPRLQNLQKWLMDDDCWLPGRLRTASLAGRQGLRLALEGPGSDPAVLFDGEERQIDDGPARHWSSPPGTSLVASWDAPCESPLLRLVFDSDLNDAKKMPYRRSSDGRDLKMPASLVRAFRVEIRREQDGDWQPVHETQDNVRRLVVLPLDGEVQALRWTGLDTWGAPEIRLFSLDVCPAGSIPVPHEPEPGRHWNDIVAGLDPADLQPPDHDLEKRRGQSRVGA
jgi:hypothetical protein